MHLQKTSLWIKLWAWQIQGEGHTTKQVAQTLQKTVTVLKEQEVGGRGDLD